MNAGQQISRAQLAAGMICNLNKPADWTSFDVVNKLRHASRVRKVGHAGTLDPFATGVLLVCFGPATKRVEELMQLEKEYVATLELGQETDTHDLTGKVTARHEVPLLHAAELAQSLERYRGEILQTPPLFSALKRGGVRLYVMARQGQSIEIAPRPVNIYEIEVVSVQMPEVNIRLVCSRGTYVRALARDWGETLGCGAYVKALQRTRIGGYTAAQALPVAQFVERLID